MNANELTALIGECLRETDNHKFFLKLESVLRQQQAEIESLKALVDELAGYKASYENCHRMCSGYGMN